MASESTREPPSLSAGRRNRRASRGTSGARAGLRPSPIPRNGECCSGRWASWARGPLGQDHAKFINFGQR
eukprot:3501729-Alexandrium_andersonii.AAC.1